jgi:hypothetical protein
MWTLPLLRREHQDANAIRRWRSGIEMSSTVNKHGDDRSGVMLIPGVEIVLGNLNLVLIHGRIFTNGKAFGTVLLHMGVFSMRIEARC